MGVFQVIIAVIIAPSLVPLKIKYKDITIPIYHSPFNASQRI